MDIALCLPVTSAGFFLNCRRPFSIAVIGCSGGSVATGSGGRGIAIVVAVIVFGAVITIIIVAVAAAGGTADTVGIATGAGDTIDTVGVAVIVCSDMIIVALFSCRIATFVA